MRGGLIGDTFKFSKHHLNIKMNKYQFGSMYAWKYEILSDSDNK